MKDFLKQIVYGGLDGIVTTFAVVASFSGATLSGLDVQSASFLTVLLFGLGNLFADGLSMGLGDFLSSRAEQDLNNGRTAELGEEIVKEIKLEEKLSQTSKILSKQGFTVDQAAEISRIFATNPKYWARYLHEAREQAGGTDNPALNGLVTFGSFITLGGIPLIPFVLLAGSSTEFVFGVSSAATFLALIILGIIRWRVSGQNALRAILEVVVIGSVAAASAFIVGSLVG